MERSGGDGSRRRLTVHLLLLLLLLSECPLLLLLELLDVELDSLTTTVTCDERLAFVDDRDLAVPAKGRSVSG
jgi:hypothetical protein